MSMDVDGRFISRSDALLILRGWLDKSSRIGINLEFKDVALSLFATVVGVSDTELRFNGDGGRSELVISLRRKLDFLYTDPRRFPDDAVDVVCGLIITFDAPPEEGTFDTVVLEERRT